MSTVSSINPYTGKVLETYDAFDLVELDFVLEGIAATQQRWQQTNLQDRAKALTALASELRKQQTTLARLATLEMGKTLASAEAEVEKCAWPCDAGR